MKKGFTARQSVFIAVPKEKVWEALVTPSLIKEYFFGTETISDFKKGSSIIYRGEWDGKTYEDKGTILEVIPNKLLKYNYWSSMSPLEDTPENYSDITYLLKEEKEGTIFEVEQDNCRSEEVKKHSEENWKAVKNNMKLMLEK